MRLTRTTFSLRGISAAAAALSVNLFAVAQTPPALYSDELPKGLEGVGVTEKLGELAPLDIQFKDEQGKSVTLRDYIEPGKPIIVTPVYYNCPMLCTLTLNGLVNGLKEIDLTAGKDFTIVSYSINHEEEPELAEVKKRAYLTQYTRESVKDGWHFLTGSKESIQAMCDGVGFGFKPDGDEFAHSSTIIFITPEGKIARYLNDMNFVGRDLKFALIETAQGAIGSPMDKMLLFFCYDYDPLANSYAASARKLMMLGGFVTVIVVFSGLMFLWWRSPRTHGTAVVEVPQ
jgi:protein SCO1